MKRTITITQEIEISIIDPACDKEKAYAVALDWIKNDHPVMNHRSSAGYQIKSVKNSLKILEQ